MKLAALALALVTGCRAGGPPPIVHHATAEAHAYDRARVRAPAVADVPDLSDADLMKLAEQASASQGPECVLLLGPAH